MSEGGWSARIEVIERGYEYLLAYAAQGRQDDVSTELRPTLTAMHEALTAMRGQVRGQCAALPSDTGIADFIEAVERDIAVARGAIGLVLTHERIPSLLVDNLNASVHLRALLTDLFLLEQSAQVAAR